MNKTLLIFLSVILMKVYLTHLCKSQHDFNESRLIDKGPTVKEILAEKTAFGNGTFGELFLIEWGKDVYGPIQYAVKMLNEKWAKDTTKIEQFKNEISLLHEVSQLGKIGPKFIDCYAGKKGILVVMELVPCSFDKLIHNRNGDGAKEIADLCESSFASFPGTIKFLFIKEMMVKVGQLHAHGLVHHDIKPANIALASKDSIAIRLLDFGFASKKDNQVFSGTPNFMHPLKILHLKIDDEKELDQIHKIFREYSFLRSDIWSLALTIYYIIKPALFSQLDTKCFMSIHIKEYLKPFIEEMHKGQWIKDSGLEFCSRTEKTKVCFSDVIRSMARIEYSEIEDKMQTLISTMNEIQAANADQFKDAETKFIKPSVPYRRLSEEEQQAIIKEAQARMQANPNYKIDKKNGPFGEFRSGREVSINEEQNAIKCPCIFRKSKKFEEGLI